MRAEQPDGDHAVAVERFSQPLDRCVVQLRRRSALVHLPRA
ncbi:MAG: hypothetical protein ACRDL4_06185 [Thermoleophilaceae bacterium]